MITSILGGLNGRKVELNEYMDKIQKPDSVKKELEWIFEELKSEKINSKLLSLIKARSEKGEAGSSATSPEVAAPKQDTLYDFVNSDSVSTLIADASNSYQQLEVTLFSF